MPAVHTKSVNQFSASPTNQARTDLIWLSIFYVMTITLDDVLPIIQCSNAEIVIIFFLLNFFFRFANRVVSRSHLSSVHSRNDSNWLQIWQTSFEKGILPTTTSWSQPRKNALTVRRTFYDFDVRMMHDRWEPFAIERDCHWRSIVND